MHEFARIYDTRIFEFKIAELSKYLRPTSLTHNVS